MTGGGSKAGGDGQNLHGMGLPAGLFSWVDRMLMLSFHPDGGNFQTPGRRHPPPVFLDNYPYPASALDPESPPASNRRTASARSASLSGRRVSMATTSAKCSPTDSVSFPDSTLEASVFCSFGCEFV